MGTAIVCFCFFLEALCCFTAVPTLSPHDRPFCISRGHMFGTMTSHFNRDDSNCLRYTIQLGSGRCACFVMCAGVCLACGPCHVDMRVLAQAACLNIGAGRGSDSLREKLLEFKLRLILLEASTALVKTRQHKGRVRKQSQETGWTKSKHGLVQVKGEAGNDVETNGQRVGVVLGTLFGFPASLYANVDSRLYSRICSISVLFLPCFFVGPLFSFVIPICNRALSSLRSLFVFQTQPPQPCFLCGGLHPPNFVIDAKNRNLNPKNPELSP